MIRRIRRGRRAPVGRHRDPRFAAGRATNPSGTTVSGRSRLACLDSPMGSRPGAAPRHRRAGPCQPPPGGV